MFRVESEETQDYVRETLAVSQEEADGMGIVPSATYWCDNRCSEKAIRYWQMTSMIEEDGEARAINLCKLRYNVKLVQQGKKSLKLWEWKEVVEKKAHPNLLWKVFASEQFLRGMWEYSTLKRAWARKFVADAAQEKQKGRQGQWQQESLPSKRFWNKSKEVWIQIAVPRQCLHRNEAWQLGEF